MTGRYGRHKTFTPATVQPTGIDWLGKLKGLLEIRFEDAVTNETLSDCLNAALEHVENFTGRVIRTGLMRVEYECWIGLFSLPFLPFVSTLAVTDLDDAVLLHAKSSNSVLINAPNGCVLTYQAGYGDTCPPALQMAVLKTALTYYELRSNVAIGTISNLLPQGAEDLMEAFIIIQDS